MKFEELMRTIQAASADPKRLALAVLEITLADRPLQLSRVLEAAAVPRWFDATILEQMLDDDLRFEAKDWFDRLLSLSCIERFEAREAWNVHETTRLALRERLQTNDPGRMVELAARAMNIFGGQTTKDHIERTYHQILVNPTGCYEALRELDFAVQACPADGLALAQAVAEYPAHAGWSTLTRAWALLLRALNLESYRGLTESLGDYLAAERLFQEAGHPAGFAWIQDSLGRLLETRFQPGDAERALGHHERSLEIREGLLEANPESAHAARDVSVSLGNLATFLGYRGLPGDAERALGNYERSLKILEQLMEAYPDSAEANRDVSMGLSNLAEFLASRGLSGDSDRALEHYERGLVICERMLDISPESALAARDVSLSLSRLADFLARRGLPGDAERAAGYLERDLVISERLLEANPESAQAARDLSVSLDKLATFLASRSVPGDAERAMRHRARSLVISERLLEANPESAEAKRDVSMVLGNFAELLASRGLLGDSERALGYFERGLEIREQLLRANPESAHAARGVLIGLNGLADFLASRGLPGDSERALGYYERGLAIPGQLLEANPESAVAARDVLVSSTNLADFLSLRGLSGDGERALGHYERSLAIGERLLEVNPDSAQAARDVSVSSGKLADFLLLRGLPGDGERALGYYKRSLTISERLLGANPDSAQAARDMSVSLNNLADFLLLRGLPGDGERALCYYERSLTISQQLLGANPDSAQAARDVSTSLNKLADLLSLRGLSGDGERALGHYERSLAISERLMGANPDSAQAARDVSVSLDKLADFLSLRGLSGDGERALGHYERSLAISERVMGANPDSAQAARDVSMSLNKLADFLSLRGLSGDGERALGHYERSLAISERLLDASPDSAQAARDVSVSLDKLADFLSLRGLPGDGERALGHYERSLAISERVMGDNPDSAQAARDVSMSLNKLADFLSLRGLSGDGERAMGHYERSLAISERLLEANPDTAQTARDVSLCLEKLADFLWLRGHSGDGERALSYYERSLAIGERLLGANPDSAEAARDVSVSLEKLADFLSLRGLPGDGERALGHYEGSLAISERLLDASPDSAQAARDVSVSLDKLAYFLSVRGLFGDGERAVCHYERSLTISERLLEANPDSAQAARDVSMGLNKLADFLSLRGLPGDGERAVGHYERSLAIRERLLEATPDSAQAARDVSVSSEKLADLLSLHGLLVDGDRAVGHYERSLAISERLLEANLDSAQAARDVLVSLEKLADFLSRRGLPGDGERAMGHYERGLEVSERLLQANPDSAQAARDVSVSLDGLGDLLSRRGLPGDGERAMGYYERSLQVRERLLQANPDSALAVRDASVSHLKLCYIHRELGDEHRAQQSLAACFAILNPFAHAGRHMDAQMHELHAYLTSIFINTDGPDQS